MKISISNIAWEPKNNDLIYGYMKDNGFTGLEIAPTIIIPDSPYDHVSTAICFAEKLRDCYGLSISSMQSIWYGITAKIFGTSEEREALAAYTKKAIDFAEKIDCHNLVFGCPRNRSIPVGADPSIAVSFFRELGKYAFEHNTAIALEANPPIYHTNYINTTSEALDLIHSVDSEGFKLNLDIGTMLENNEDISILVGMEGLINHVHISEPGLAPLQKRAIHQELADFLHSFSYKNYVSIEVGRQDNINTLFQMMDYISATFS